MFIKEIKPLGVKKQKYKVCLEGGTDFVLYRREVADYDLREEAELSEETYRRILQETLIPRAKKRALHLLEKMDRTEANLSGKLKENGYPPEAIAEALSYVASYHYTDDDRYAHTYVRQYCGSRSKMRILQDLLQKGVQKETAEAAIEEEYETSEEELIRTLLQKKGYDPENTDRKEREKMYRFLAQRGFQSRDILSVLEEWE